MRRIRQALRDEFGQSLSDQEFKIAFDAKLTVAAWSCLALNPCMVGMLESDTFGGFTITLRHFAALKKAYEQFVLLREDEYYYVVTEQIIHERIRNYPSDTYVIRSRSDQVISWRALHLAFQTIYIYSDVVGDVRANLLRVIAPKESHGEVISENFVHLFYNDVRVKSFNTIEILLKGYTGRPIPFCSFFKKALFV